MLTYFSVMVNCVYISVTELVHCVSLFSSDGKLCLYISVTELDHCVSLFFSDGQLCLYFSDRTGSLCFLIFQ